MTPPILIHGAGDSAAVWQPQLTYFGPERAVAIDLPGHGARLAEESHADHAANARETLRLMDARRVERPVIAVGHSMGGAAAARRVGRPGDGRKRPTPAYAPQYAPQPRIPRPPRPLDGPF